MFFFFGFYCCERDGSNCHKIRSVPFLLETIGGARGLNVLLSIKIDTGCKQACDPPNRGRHCLKIASFFHQRIFHRPVRHYPGQ